MMYIILRTYLPTVTGHGPVMCSRVTCVSEHHFSINAQAWLGIERDEPFHLKKLNLCQDVS